MVSGVFLAMRLEDDVALARLLDDPDEVDATVCVSVCVRKGGREKERDSERERVKEER